MVEKGQRVKIPNNPMQAYLMGKRHGAQESMDLVAMALADKAEWHIRSTDPEDRQSIEWLYGQMEYYASEVNSGHLKRKEVKKMLEEEYQLQFAD